MNHENLMLDAVDAVSQMEVPDEDLAVALTQQVKLMTNQSVDNYWSPADEPPLH